MTSRRLVLLLVAVVALLALPGVANATVTTTQITSPSAPGFPLWNDDTSTGSINVAGTAPGATDGDTVDIRCYTDTGPSNYSTLSANVVVSGGAFAATDVSLAPAYGEYCKLAAVPSGANPADLSPFAGPAFPVNYVETSLNSGKLYDYYYWFGQGSGAFDYDSASSCGIDDSYLRNPVTGFRSATAFYCNQWFESTADGSASGVQIDGVNAFLAGRASGLGAAANFQPLTVSVSVNPANGDATIQESSVFMTCPANVWPPTIGNCMGLTALPVRLNRTIVQNHDGLVATVTDDFVSLDGQPHSISVGYQQNFCMRTNYSGTCSTPIHTYTFPGHAPIADPAGDQLVNGPFAPTTTIYVNNAAAPDGDLGTGRVAMTFFPEPNSATFDSERSFMLSWNNRVVPATGSLRIDGAFSQSFTQAQLEQLVAANSAAITPQPTITAGTAKAKYDKKKKRVNFTSNESIACPAGGVACTITATLSTKVKLPAKKKSKSKKHSKKKPKAKYKTYKFKAISIQVAPGTVSPPLVWTLPSYANKLFAANKSLKFTLGTSVAAGPYAAASNTAVLKVKSPKMPKSKKKKSSKKKR